MINEVKELVVYDWNKECLLNQLLLKHKFLNYAHLFELVLLSKIANSCLGLLVPAISVFRQADTHIHRQSKQTETYTDIQRQRHRQTELNHVRDRLVPE